MRKRNLQIICNYYQKIEHKISECRKLKWKQEWKREKNQIKTFAKINAFNKSNKKFVSVNSKNLFKNKFQFLVDSGASTSLIKSEFDQ